MSDKKSRGGLQANPESSGMSRNTVGRPQASSPVKSEAF